jgi:hypothetical protein
VLLGVLAGVAAGLAIAAVDGATRTGTAYERQHEQLQGADVVYFPSQVLFDDADVSKLSTLPEVAAVGGFSLTASAIDGFPPGATPFVAVGDDWFQSIERPKLLAGRLPDPSRDDEAVITEPVLHQGVHLGQQVTWRNLSPAQGKQYQYMPPLDFDWVHQAQGPTTNLNVVGVVQLPLEAVASFAPDGLLIVGPGWARAHLDQSAREFTNALVRLRHGGDDVAAFTAAAARLYGRSDVPVKDFRDDSKRVKSSIDLERTALLLFAAAVAAAAAVLVGQAFVRSVRAGADAVPVLEAMGLVRSGLVSGLSAPHLLTLIVALPVAAVSAVLLSTRFPIGLARRLDPDLGAHVDPLVLAVGLAVLAAIIVALVVGTAWLTARASSAPRRATRMRVIGAASRVGAPLPAAIGASLALEPAPGRSSSSVRPVLVAGIAGVVAVVASLTLVGGIDDALHRPQRVGTVWDLEVQAPETVDKATAVRAIVAQPDVESVAIVYRGATVVDGADAPLYALDQQQGSVEFVVLDGRRPEGNDEIMMGPRTAKITHAHIGDTVKVGPQGVEMHIVGIGLLAQTAHTSFDEGALVALGAYETASGSKFDQSDQAGLVRVRDGADPAAVATALAGDNLDAEPPSPVPTSATWPRCVRCPSTSPASWCCWPPARWPTRCSRAPGVAATTSPSSAPSASRPGRPRPASRGRPRSSAPSRWPSGSHSACWSGARSGA